MITIKILKDEEVGSIIDVHCNDCKKTTRQEVLSDVTRYGQEIIESDEHVYNWMNEYQIIQCRGCESITFRELHADTDHTQMVDGPDGYRRDYIKHEKRYPNNVKDRLNILDLIHAPNKVIHIYQETARSLSNNMPILTGIGIRAIIETVSKALSIKKGSLEKKINILKNKGFITSQNAQTLHSLRKLGNKSAHEVTSHTEQELSAAFDIVEHLLKSIYIMPERAKSVPQYPDNPKNKE